MNKFFIACGVLLLTGCAATLPVAPYSAQNYIRYNGSTGISDFTYTPFINGKVKSNQVQNTAVGQIMIASDIASVAQRGTALELEKTGIKLSDSGVSLKGDVDQMMFDDLGYSVRVRYTITYSFIDSKGVEIFRRTYSPDEKKIGKFGAASDYSNAVNEMVLAGYSKFIVDPDVKRILQTGK